MALSARILFCFFPKTTFDVTFNYLYLEVCEVCIVLLIYTSVESAIQN